ncbi:MAG: NAD(+)/NADH kinase, partial [Chloroflexota bacterium]|nr:NAD(+)/NADH kinase [Chloroflexota bacterium]
EKINIVRRALLAMDAIGVETVWHLPDTYFIVQRAAEGAGLTLSLRALPMEVLGNASDSYEAARRMADLGCGAIMTLGGDGTNRIVAKGCGEVPLVAVSTGTNNVFPRMVEGTLAGIAAGLVALGQADGAVQRMPRLDVVIDDGQTDIALIDVVTSPHAWIGARAVWEPSHIREIVLSRIACGEIGICAIGGLLYPDLAGMPVGAYVCLGEGAGSVQAPLAPGVVRRVPVAKSRTLEPGGSVSLEPVAGTIALDGEREIELLSAVRKIDVRLNPDGPRVVDIPAAIRLGALSGVFQSS